MAILRVSVILALLVSASLAELQTITVKGELKCGDKPATPSDTAVRLLNKKFGFDDKTDVTPVNPDGTYKLTLSADRSFDFDPEVHIYTNCNDEKWGIPKTCRRKWSIKIPDKYVGHKGQKKGDYDVGRFNMENKLDDEDRECKLTFIGR